jgi:hypothetical protein
MGNVIPFSDDAHRRYRLNDPDTSQQAAELIDSDRLRRLQFEVWQYFTTVPRATQLDVEDYFNDHRSTYRSRVPELVEKGLLRFTGFKRLQKGRNRRVYELARYNKTEKEMTTPTSIDTRVEQYVKIRDKIKDLEKIHDDTVKPYKDALEGLNALLLQHLQELGVESARTSSGTVYRSNKTSASVADPAAFFDFVLANKTFDLLDKRANKTAVSDYVKDNGTPPPGVNYTVSQVVGVRRG